MAAHSASELGIRVKNERPQPQSSPDVAVLATQRLHAGPYPVLRNVFCEMEDGRLVLKGRVGSYYLKQVAQSTVARVPGVVAIDNQIDVVIPR